MTLWTAGLVAAAWAAERLLRRWVGPGWRIALFAVVVVRVLLPVDWVSPAGQLAADHLVRFQDGLPAASSSTPHSPPADARTAEATPVVPISGHHLPSLSALGAPPLVRPPGWGIAALLLYALGIAVVAARLALSQRRLTRARHAARPARASLRAMTTDAEILEHDSVGPVAFGVIVPTILIPTAVADELSLEELRCIIAHECAHHRRRDPALALVLVAVCAALWPVIPVWIATGRMRHLMELAADAAAIRNPSITPQRLGRVLLRLADRRVTRLVGITGMATRYSEVRSRIISLRTQSRPASAIQFGLAVGISGLLLACAGVVHPEISLLEERAADAFARGEYQRSTQLYADLQTANPDHERACAWQGQVVANAQASNADDRVTWQAMVRLVEYVQDDVQDECWRSAERTLRLAATGWHDKAEKTRSVTRSIETYALSRRAYERYADVFDDAPDAYTLRYYQAEAVWAVASRHADQAQEGGDHAGQEASLREFSRAHELFVDVVELDPTGAYFRDAAYAQLLAAKNALELPGAEHHPDQGALIAAYDRYLAAMDGVDDPRVAALHLEREKLNAAQP